MGQVRDPFMSWRGSLGRRFRACGPPGSILVSYMPVSATTAVWDEVPAAFPDGFAGELPFVLVATRKAGAFDTVYRSLAILTRLVIDFRLHL